jgi:hypothetical protein
MRSLIKSSGPPLIEQTVVYDMAAWLIASDEKLEPLFAESLCQLAYVITALLPLNIS